MAEISIIYQLDVPNKRIVNKFTSPSEIAKVYPNFKMLTIKPCIRGRRETAYGYNWVEGSHNMNFDQYFIDHRPDNLLVDVHPELVAQWNYEKNIGVDIGSIAYGSDTKVWWLCPLGHNSYDCSLNNRTAKSSPRGCPECGLDINRCHDKKEKEEYIKNRGNGVSTTLVGDETEDYVVNLLKSSGQFLDIIKTGHTGDNADVIITLNSYVKKSLPVKTLTPYNNYYACHAGLDYEADMLIAMVDKKREHFAVAFARNVLVDKLCLSFDSGRKTKYDSIMFRTAETFLQKLIELIPESTNYTGFNSSPTIIKENNSLLRFEKYCSDNKLEYKRNPTNGNAIDLYVNNVPIQAKSRSVFASSLTVTIGLTKGGGRINGKSVKMKYCAEKDLFDYLLAEVAGTKEDPTKYCGYFFFISKKDLIDLGYLKSATTEGQNGFTICTPDYPKDHWSKKYWLPLILSDQQKANLFTT